MLLGIGISVAGADISTETPEGEGWIPLAYDDFEQGLGNYTDGGWDCSLYTYGTYKHQGRCAMDIQDNSGDYSSFYTTNGMNVTMYTEIKIEF